MARLSLLAIAVVALAASAAAWPHAGTVQNKFIVTYSIIPDPFHMKSFFTMPRTLREAENDKFVFSEMRPQDNTSVYCRDFRVCVIFDQKESVAGIRLSVRKSEIDASGFDLKDVPEWELNMSSLELDYVYSATVFFQSKEDLLAGGRTLSAEDLTAPNGIYILQTDSEGRERNRLHVPTAQSEAETAGFTEQACFFGMGKHYFQELRKDGRCEDHRPYFMLYGPQTKKLNGFGFVQFGKVTTGDRPWFESPPAAVAKMIAPNSPACLGPWVSNRGLFTMHVYFVSDPYYTTC